MKSQKEMEWGEKYGKLSEEELQEKMKGSLFTKLEAYYGEKNEAGAARKAKYNLPYFQYATKIKECEKRVSELRISLDEMRQTERKRLEKEFDNLVRLDVERESITRI